MSQVNGFKKLIVVTLLGFSAMACSSPEQDVDAIDNQQVGTHDNKDIADGTDQEEHVSTY